jgi:hypothetical protein
LRWGNEYLSAPHRPLRETMLDNKDKINSNIHKLIYDYYR